MMDVMSLVWVMGGKWAAQRALCRRVKAKLGRKTKVRVPGNVCNDALHVIRLFGPGDKVSLFLQD